MAIFYQPPEPRQAYPKVLPQTQGAQPKPAGPLGGSVNALTAMGVWATLASVPMPIQKPLNVVPLTFKYGSQPAPQPSLTLPEQVIARVWWPEAFEPRLQFNAQQPERKYIAPLTLVYGQQPRPSGPLSPSETNKLVRWWDAPFQYPASAPASAGWNVPAVVTQVPYTRVTISWPPDGPLPQAQARVAPLTLRYGDPPPVDDALSETEMSLLARWWEPPRTEPPVLVKIIPLTYGQNPPVFVSFQAIGVVAPWWNAQSASPSAAWNVPVAIASQPPFSLQAHIIRGTWESVRLEPPALLKIAPLTLVYGQQPPSFVPFQAIGVVAPWWNAQSASPNAAWNFPVAIVNQPIPFTAQAHIVRLAWEPPYQYPASEENSAGWNVPVIASQPIPFTAQQHIVRLAWEPLYQYPASEENSAGWNVPVVVSSFTPYARLQAHILAPLPFQVRQLRVFVVPATAPGVESSALSGVARSYVEVTGAVLISPELSSALFAIPELAGHPLVAPQLTGHVIVAPQLFGIIHIYPVP